ncbi:MAG: hypothetical protein ACYTAO_06590 [Planctomycetota bacterium]|jgi:hypothetical protein
MTTLRIRHNQRDFIKAVGLSAAPLALPGLADAGQQNGAPNIVIFSADDPDIYELFDLVTDPCESNNLVEANPQTFRQLRDKLDEYMRAAVRPLALENPLVEGKVPRD